MNSSSHTGMSNMDATIGLFPTLVPDTDVQGQQLQAHEEIPAPEKVKKILVVGGGPADMEAAITAANHGHDVTLVEKGEKLGGNLHPAGAPYFKEDIIGDCRNLRQIYYPMTAG